jgi:hypothetical protein
MDWYLIEGGCKQMFEIKKSVEIFTIVGLILNLLISSCSSGDNSGTGQSNASADSAGTPVQVSVSATDPDGDQLHYRWASTEGTINNVDAPTTTWIVPTGTGLQFAYVVVSDGKGGYTESRAAALTYDQTPPQPTGPADITPPPLKGNAGYIWGSVFFKSSFGRNVYLPNVTVTLAPDGAKTVTDSKGEFFISNLRTDISYTATYQISGASNETLSPITASTPRTSRSNILAKELSLSNRVVVAGHVRLADQGFCGIRNEFFADTRPADVRDPRLFAVDDSGTAHTYGTAQLLDNLGNPLTAQTFPINHYGDFVIVRTSVTAGQVAKVRVRCDADGSAHDSPTFSIGVATNPPSQFSGAIKVPFVITVPNSRPTVKSMVVLRNGQDVGRPDLPKPRTLFTNLDGTSPRFGIDDDARNLIAEISSTPGDDTFFTYKGIDTRRSACAYYRAIGAVQGCDENGSPTGAQLTLNQWKATYNLFPFSGGNPNNLPASDGHEVRIQYVNRSDLNLVRDMQAVKLSNGDLAYNVCNYPGPQDVNNPLGAPKEIGAEQQADIDLAIENARRSIGMIVCVAMDYSPVTRLTRFYTFGPTGKLFLSVSLDGRREKFMPGSCTACHGGAAYGGRYPDDGTGRPDIQSHWQPFDMSNLKVKFSSQDELNAIKLAIKTLNQRMVGGGAVPPDPRYDPMTTPRTRELITNWYKIDRPGRPAGLSPLDQDPSFIPQSVTNNFGGPTLSTIYKQIIQPGCQTCHAAQGTTTVDIPELTDTTRVCGGSEILDRNHTMPNSLVPFERFWLDPSLPPLLGCGTKPTKHHAL